MFSVSGRWNLTVCQVSASSASIRARSRNFAFFSSFCIILILKNVLNLSFDENVEKLFLCALLFTPKGEIDWIERTNPGGCRSKPPHVRGHPFDENVEKLYISPSCFLCFFLHLHAKNRAPACNMGRLTSRPPRNRWFLSVLLVCISHLFQVLFWVEELLVVRRRSFSPKLLFCALQFNCVCRDEICTFLQFYEICSIFLVVESTASSIFLHFKSLTFNHRQAETDTDVCISLGCEKMQEFSFFVAKTYAIFEFSTFFDFFSKKISIFFVPSRAMCVSGVRRPSAISCAPERASFFSFEMKFWNFREFSWFFAVFWYCSDEISRVPPNWELRLGMWLLCILIEVSARMVVRGVRCATAHGTLYKQYNPAERALASSDFFDIGKQWGSM